jgi:hypothetical protein
MKDCSGENPQLATLRTLLQMSQDHKMHERYYTVRDFTMAADLRIQGNRLATVAERLEKISQEEMAVAAGGTRPTLEKDAPLSIEQMELINHRDVVPFMAILWYGHGGEPPEFMEIKGELTGKMQALRGVADMLFGYMKKHFEGDEVTLIRPDEGILEGSLWRTRLTAGLYRVATYYRLAAESVAMALKTLYNAPLAGKDLAEADKRARAVLMLKWTVAFLNDAATYMGMAGTELGKDEERWRHTEASLASILTQRGKCDACP